MLVGRPSSGYSEGFLLGFQVGRCRSGVRVADGGDQVFAGERVQRFQPVHRYQHERGLRGDLRHHSGGAGAIFAGPVTQLAQSEECSREEMLARLKDMYDSCPFLIGKMRLSGILPVLPASCFSPRLDVARYAFG